MSLLSITASGLARHPSGHNRPQVTGGKVEGPRRTPRHWSSDLAIWSPGPPAVPPRCPSWNENSRSSPVSAQMHPPRPGRARPWLPPSGPAEHFNNRRIGSGSDSSELGTVTEDAGCLRSQAAGREGAAPTCRSPDQGQAAEAQAQLRGAQEGFLEEGSPPPKLEEHTVQPGGGAPSSPWGGGEGCAAPGPKAVVEAPSPGEVSGVGGPMGR